jgi:hypothetical protein
VRAQHGNSFPGTTSLGSTEPSAPALFPASLPRTGMRGARGVSAHPSPQALLIGSLRGGSNEESAASPRPESWNVTKY